jgi:hypothetical protein
VLNQRVIDVQIMQENRRGSRCNETGLRKMRGCSKCGKTGHNIRICQDPVESPQEADSEVIIVRT